MIFVRDDEHRVPAVFAADDQAPRRVWLRIELAKGEIACFFRARHRSFDEEWSFSFYCTDRRGLLLNLIAWRTAEFS